MSEHEIAPLDEETQRVLEAEKVPPKAPPGAANRVLERLQVSFVAPPDPGTRVPSRPAQPLVQSGLGASGRLAVAFVLGGIAGAAGHAWITKTPIVSAPAARSERRESVPPPNATMASPAMSAEKGVPSPMTELPPPSESAATPSSDLRAERALLDHAQRAFARGDLTVALTALNAHARRYPHGRLEEEREALAVKALAGAGRHDDAKARGARFRMRYSDSILLPAVEEALRSIP